MGSLMWSHDTWSSLVGSNLVTLQVSVCETAEATAQAAHSLAELAHLLPCKGLFGEAPALAAHQGAAVRQAGQQAEVWTCSGVPVPDQASFPLEV